MQKKRGGNLHALETARNRLREAKEAGIVIKHASPMEKAADRKRSYPLAARAMCWHCVGEGADVNAKETIRHCSQPPCPLWPLRQWQAQTVLKQEHIRKRISKNDPMATAAEDPTSYRKAIAAKCYECMGGSKLLVHLCTSTGCPLHTRRPWQKDRPTERIK